MKAVEVERRGVPNVLPSSQRVARGQALRAHAARYVKPDDRTAWRMLTSTFVVYGASLCAGTLLLGLLQAAEDWQQRIALGIASTLAVIALAGAMVRAFMMHHDLCHGGFFSSRALNALLAPLAGTLVSTSSSVWTREHDRHHRESNNLDHPQYGETAAWTVDAYERAPLWQRWLYFLVNQRPILFIVIPPFYFLGFMRVCARVPENVLFVVFALALYQSGAWLPFALALVPASWLGFLVFHATHTFEGVLRRRTPSWDFVDNALFGSSMIVVPERGFLAAWLRWALCSLQYHHVHHLHPGIPAYRLALCHEAGGVLFDGVRRVTFGDAIRATRFTLFDEASASLATFAGRKPWHPRRCASSSLRS